MTEAQVQNKRPLSVTIVSFVYIAAGLVGFVYHLSDWKLPLQHEIVWISLVRLLAIVAGLFMLRGSNWARWLALIWITFHVVVGALHGWTQLLPHALLLTAIAFFLLRRPATQFFENA
jgi:hypothetical protein